MVRRWQCGDPHLACLAMSVAKADLGAVGLGSRWLQPAHHCGGAVVLMLVSVLVLVVDWAVYPLGNGAGSFTVSSSKY